MNTQVHETTGHSLYKLGFGQKLHPVLFAGAKRISVVNEEDVEEDGIAFEDIGVSEVN